MISTQILQKQLDCKHLLLCQVPSSFVSSDVQNALNFWYVVLIRQRWPVHKSVSMYMWDEPETNFPHIIYSLFDIPLIGWLPENLIK